ncbi:hypothetical protein CF328_g7723 [Tilletia controversa]|nr:hypothetical protein CF328_g7723 [Tilletia controversa]
MVWSHNHSAHFITNNPPSGQTPIPPAEKALIQALTASGTAKTDRRAVWELLRAAIPGSALSLRQVSNVIDNTKRARHQALSSMGGDVAFLLSWLAEEKNKDARLIYHFQVHQQTGVLQRLFVSSAPMIDALQQFGDVVIADVAQGRNVYNMPLNLFSVVDGAGRTRNVAYVVQDREDQESHEWVLTHLLATYGNQPRIIVSDQDAGFSSAVQSILPSSHHILCIWHIWQNITKNVKPKLRGKWPKFAEVFWCVYKAPSPAAFEKRWTAFLQMFPSAEPYLGANQYHTRKSWAAAWVRTKFTVNVRTTGRVESENGVNKLLGGRKTTLTDLFKRLLCRADDQLEHSTQACKSLHKKASPAERLFQPVVDLMREYCHIGATRHAFKEMEEGVTCEVTDIPVRA